MNVGSEEKILEEVELEKLSKLVSSSKKSSLNIAIISALLTIIGISFSISSYLNLSIGGRYITNMDTSFVIDSFGNMDNGSISSEKELGVINFVTEYLTNLKPDSSLHIYYADRVENYYLLRNIGLDQIRKEKQRFKKKHPKSKLTFNQSDISVSLKEDNTSEVFVNTLYYPDSTRAPREIIYQIKLNNQNKVYFVRNLEPSSRK
jgi:hypothetical protein